MKSRYLKLLDYINTLKDQGVRRTYFYEQVAESLKETKEKPRQIRRALAFAHMIDSVDLIVQPYELLVGSIIGNWPVDNTLPEYKERRKQAIERLESFKKQKQQGDYVKNARYAFIASDFFNANIEHSDYQKLLAEMKVRYKDDILEEYEIGRELGDLFLYDYGDDVMMLYNELPYEVSHHNDLNYKKPLKYGLGGLLSLAQKGYEDNKEAEPDKAEFYEAVIISLQATTRYIKRYAQAVIETAENADEKRKIELLKIAEILEKISTGVPETFHEALQLVWMLHVIQITNDGGAMSFARFDQYMYPFYKYDIENNISTREEIQELLCHMWVKINEPKMKTVQSLCLAGEKPDGSEGLNDLTILCLEVARLIRTPYPNLALRVSKNSPEWLVEEAVKTIMAGSGQPMLLNDDMWVPNLVKRKFALEHARDYYNMGCVEVLLEGKQAGWNTRSDSKADSATRHPVMLIHDLVHEAASGNDYVCFDDFFAEFKHRAGNIMLQEKERGRTTLRVMKNHYDPYASAFMDDCLERGCDIFHNGTFYGRSYGIGLGFGIGNITDSLMVIKEYVYDKKTVTFEQLKSALDNNFEGSETLRCIFANKSKCYGNNDSEADKIANEVMNTIADAVHSLNEGEFVGHYGTSMFSYTAHVNTGELVNATPDGRLKGTPLSDASGPAQGKDRNGPTSLIHSVLSLDHRNISAASAFNLKFDKTLVSGAQGIHALTGLLLSYIKAGGIQVQVNFDDPEELLKARKNPEKYRHLVVRVAGFSEYFYNLDPKVQDEVISRTLHKV